MAQEYIRMNCIKIRQPDTGIAWNTETTYGQGSGRSMLGVAQVSPLFTVEALGYTATGVTAAEMKQILQIIAKGNIFNLHYFSPYFGEWRTDEFYVGKGDLSVRSLRESKETYDSISFQMTGVNPI